MANIRQKVNQYLWITLATSFFVLFIIISYLIQGYNTTLKVNQYKTQGEIFAEIIKTNGTNTGLSSYYEKLASRDDDASFIYYSPSGEVILSDSPRKTGRLEVERLQGPEWIQMYSKEKERFVLPIKSGNKLYGFLELQIKTSIANSHLKSLWLLLLIFFVAIIFVIIFILNRFSKKFLDPVEDVAITIKELAKGNFKARTTEDPFTNTNDLSQAVNTLARSLQHILKSYDTQQERLTTLIENMGSGVVLIDAKGYITLVNKAFINQFHLEKEEVLDRLYHEILSHDKVVDLIKEIFLMEENVRRQILLTFPIERRHFEVYGAPIVSSGQTLVGIALVFHDITELKKLEQMRKDFVANVSHELRTPVTSLKGFAETLLDGAMDDPKTREKFLLIIWKESDRLQSLIQDLLELSKIEQENFSLNWQLVDLRPILEDVMLILAHRASEKEIQFTSEIVGNPEIFGDPSRMKQVMINVINNSLNYTAPGGYCSVIIEEKEHEVLFTVRDNGIGINKDEIPRIFERFYRIDKARSRNSGGTGLGLAIVKHLVDALKGQIIVDSEKGKGTIFTIIFQRNIK